MALLAHLEEHVFGDPNRDSVGAVRKLDCTGGWLECGEDKFLKDRVGHNAYGRPQVTKSILYKDVVYGTWDEKSTRTFELLRNLTRRLNFGFDLTSFPLVFIFSQKLGEVGISFLAPFGGI